jgi:hypothetical protein
VPFSLCFAEIDGRDVVIHRTRPQRVDVSDVSSGRLLTDRKQPVWEHGQPPPAHYLDYFHGALHLSPAGTKLLDDGWIWHPVGVPRVWELRPWIYRNAWESEDGPSLRVLRPRDGWWNRGACWVDETHVALEGIGDTLEEMAPGAMIFDLDTTTRDRHGTLRVNEPRVLVAGPSGEFFSDSHRLYASNPEGLSIWDLKTRARVGQIPGFSPTRQLGLVKELGQLRDNDLITWSYKQFDNE